MVNTFFDEYRRTRGSPRRVPGAMGHVYLAGALRPDRVDVRIYNEQFSGPLLDPTLLAWPDILILTGLTSSFDRMLHLTAYARTLNPAVIVVAGGPAVRALPRRSAMFFDYAASGDIEELLDIVRDSLGAEYAAEDMFPRYDLLNAGGAIGYVESSRNCNFACSFCSLSGEKGHYRPYDCGFLERQLVAMNGRHIVLIDNNFYGNNRFSFESRLEVLESFYRDGRIRSWSALVTGDFFARSANLAKAKAAGCLGLFTGVESFDPETLRSYNKKQNTVVPQFDTLRQCLEAGILPLYGIMLDPTTRLLSDLHREIAFILDSPEITLPAYFTLPIPLLGTPYFHDCLSKGLFLPNVRLHDLDGVVLSLKPRDALEDVVAFARGLPSLRGHRSRIAPNLAAFFWRYRTCLSPLQMSIALGLGILIGTTSAASSPGTLFGRRPRQTFVATTETLDPLYEPFMRVPSKFEAYFRPTMVTDSDGQLSVDVASDVLSRPA